LQDQILQQVAEIIADTLGLERLTLTRATTAADVEGWDSLANVQILVAIEKRFRIRFRTGQIAAMNNVGELIDGIERQLSGRQTA
jgi:acyl carrier protein